MSRPLVVVGDTLLDLDLSGRAGRLAPDAPVPVLDELVEVARPGGAGLAATMAAADGRDVELITALGDDDAGARVEQLLRDAGVVVHRLAYDGPTPVKRRVRAGGQSLLRLDSGTGEGTVGVGSEEQRAALAAVLSGAGAVLVADYGRGVAATGSVRDLVAALLPRTPVVWDPHRCGTDPVPGVHLVTPNEAEAAELAAHANPPAPSGDGLAAAGRRADALVAHWRARAVAVTLGDRGALLSYGSGAPVVVPAPAVTCLDPCGAGDRFAVTAALGLADGRLPTEAVGDAVAAAAAYVAAGGPASLHASTPAEEALEERTAQDVAREVAERGGTVVATGGCFDLLHAGHVATLRAARQLGDCLIVCLNSDDSVRRLKGPSRPLVPATDRARVLEALEFVDAVIVFDESTPVEVLRRIRPHVWAKGGDYAGTVVPESAVLEDWGGQAVVLPYLEGRSTTSLVRTAARADDRAQQQEVVR